MNIKYALLFLIIILISSIAQGKVEVEINDNNISVKTNTKGVGGTSGDCVKEKTKLVSPYVFILYRKEPKKKEQPVEDCLCGGSCRWDKVSTVESEIPYVLFEDLKNGRYKVEVLTGFEHNCNYEVDSDNSKNQFISFSKEITSTFDISPLLNFETNKSAPNTIFGKLNVYPNPTADILNIRLINGGLEKQVQIVLYDLLGKEVMQIVDRIDESSSVLNQSIDLKPLSEGVYLLRIFDKNGKSYENKISVHKYN